MEKDQEDGFNTTEYRQYDSRLGRWLSKDPIVKPWESPYVGFANNPIYFRDPSGLDPAGKGDGLSKDEKRDARKNGHYSNRDIRRAEKYQKENGGQLDIEHWDGGVNIIWSRGKDQYGGDIDKETFGIDRGNDNTSRSSSGGFWSGVGDFFRAWDRAWTGNSGLSVGVSIEGRESNNNKLASTAAPGAKIFTMQKETFDMLCYVVQYQGGPDSKTPYSYNKWKGEQNNRLTEQRNTGSFSPELGDHRFGDLLDASEDQPLLKTTSADEIDAKGERIVYLMMSNGEEYVQVKCKTAVGYDPIALPKTPRNMAAARSGEIIPGDQLDHDNCSIK